MKDHERGNSSTLGERKSVTEKAFVWENAKKSDSQSERVLMKLAPFADPNGLVLLTETKSPGFIS